MRYLTFRFALHLALVVPGILSGATISTADPALQAIGGISTGTPQAGSIAHYNARILTAVAHGLSVTVSGWPGAGHELTFLTRPIAAVLADHSPYLIVATEGGTVRCFYERNESPLGTLSTTMALDGCTRYGDLVVAWGYAAVEFLRIRHEWGHEGELESLGRISTYDTYDVAVTEGATYLTVGASTLRRIAPTGDVLQVSIEGVNRVAAGDGFLVVSVGSTIQYRDLDTLELLSTVGFSHPPVAVSVGERWRSAVVLLLNGDAVVVDASDLANPVLSATTQIGRGGVVYEGSVSFDRIDPEGRFLYVVEGRAGICTAPDWTPEPFLFGGVTKTARWLAGMCIAANGQGALLSVSYNPAVPFEECARGRAHIGNVRDVTASHSHNSAARALGHNVRRIPGPPTIAPEDPNPVVAAATDRGLVFVEYVAGRPAEVRSLPLGDLTHVATATGPAGEPLVLALQPTKLDIVDASDPSAPVSLASRMFSSAEDVAVDGHLAMITQAYHGIQFLDISDPANPVALGSIGGGFSSALDGGLAYIGRGDELNVYDVSDPAAPSFIAQRRLPGTYVAGITIEHRRNGSIWAWLGAGQAGVVIVDVTDPASMFEVTTFDTPDFAWEVSLHSGFAWVADGETGILQLKIVRDPFESPVETDAPIDARASRGGGLELAAFPNPARGSATLSFSLPSAGRAALSVYDVAGRHLVRVTDSQFAAGRHEFSWDGRDSAGQRVAAGVYLLRLEAGSSAATRRVVRLD